MKTGHGARPLSMRCRSGCPVGRERRFDHQAMSMYTQLLGSALEQRDRADIAPAPGDALAQLSRSRARLRSGRPGSESPTAFEAVADSLDYDVALIVLARGLDIEFAIDRFDDGERHLLEVALALRGIGVDQRDDVS